MPGGASQPRKTLDAWQEWAKQRGARASRTCWSGRTARCRARRQEPVRDRARGPRRGRGRQQRRLHLLRRGRDRASRALLGAARGEIARRVGLIDESRFEFVWVVDAPLFKPVKADDDDVALGSSAWTAVHHAFTSPKPEWIDRFEEDPGNALAYAYDIVCNGNEIGGGSIRIHRRDVQERVFQIMGIGEEEAQEKFGFLLDAFQFGAPPHGGIALGWDRVVMLLGGYDSIRDVIAFPKSGGGYDPLTERPRAHPGRAAQGDGRGLRARGGRQGLTQDPHVAAARSVRRGGARAGEGMRTIATAPRARTAAGSATREVPSPGGLTTSASAIEGAPESAASDAGGGRALEGHGTARTTWWRAPARSRDRWVNSSMIGEPMPKQDVEREEGDARATASSARRDDGECARAKKSAQQGTRAWADAAVSRPRAPALPRAPSPGSPSWRAPRTCLRRSLANPEWWRDGVA